MQGQAPLAPYVGLWSRLAGFRDEASGRELFDLPDAPRPAPDVPAPVRFLPDSDNLLLGHADRSRVMDERARRLIMRRESGMRGLLVDGMLAGHWRLDGPSLTVTPYAPLSRAELADVAAEGARLLAFHGREHGETRFD